MPMPTLIDLRAGSCSSRRAFVPDDVRVLEEPTALPLTLEEARRHLKLDAWIGGDPARPDAMGHPDDPDIMDALAGAVGEIDGENGWLGRAIAPRTLAVILDRLEPVALPLPPTLAVERIAVVDADGEGMTDLSADAHRLVPDGLYMRVEPATGIVWPARAAMVVYRAGYEPPAPGELPNVELATIRNWLKLRLTDLFMNGGSLSNGQTAPYAAHMLVNLRVRT